MVLCDSGKPGLRIRLLPNCSASWTQTKRFLLGIATLSFLVAGFWAMQGVWIILPFAGLEILVLTLVTYRVCWDCHHQQRILIGAAQIEVQWGKDRPKKCWHFPRHELEVWIHRPQHSWSAAEVALKAGDQTLPVGQRLNKDDIERLIDILENAGLPCRYFGQVERVALDGFDMEETEDRSDRQLF